MVKNLMKKAPLISVTIAFLLSIGFAQTQQLILRTLDGGTVNLNDQRGKIVVMSFGSRSNPLASKELPALQKLADRYAGRGVQFYWVSVDSMKPAARNYATDSDLQAFAQKHGLRVTVLRDPEQEAYRAFGLDALPTVVVLDRQGKVVRKRTGFGTDQTENYNEIIRDLEQLLKQQ